MIDQHIRNGVDGMSFTLIVGAIFDYLPHVAALLGVILITIRIYYEIRIGQRKLKE